MTDPQDAGGDTECDVDVPLSPPEGALRVTEDGQVLKHTLLPGIGDSPSLHACCLGEAADTAVHGHGPLMRWNRLVRVGARSAQASWGRGWLVKTGGSAGAWASMRQEGMLHNTTRHTTRSALRGPPAA